MTFDPSSNKLLTNKEISTNLIDIVYQTLQVQKKTVIFADRLMKLWVFQSCICSSGISLGIDDMVNTFKQKILIYAKKL